MEALLEQVFANERSLELLLKGLRDPMDLEDADIESLRELIDGLDEVDGLDEDSLSLDDFLSDHMGEIAGRCGEAIYQYGVERTGNRWVLCTGGPHVEVNPRWIEARWGSDRITLPVSSYPAIKAAYYFLNGADTEE
jgi:hypothetical protein